MRLKLLKSHSDGDIASDSKSSNTSHQGMHLVDDTNGKTGQTLESYQSNWIAHWMQSSLTTAEEAGNPNASRDKKLGKASVPVKGPIVVETKTTEIVDVSLLKSTGNKRICSSLFKHCRHANEELRSMLSHKLECSNAVDCRHGEHCPASNPSIPAASKLALEGWHSLADGTSKNISKSMKICYAEKGATFPLYSAGSMRICTTLINGVPGQEGCPLFSQRTHNPSIIEKIDVNPLNENDKLRNAIVVSNIDGNITGNLYHPSPVLGQQGKLQPNSSSVHSEVKANVGDVRAHKDIMKNERLAKTDPMDIDAFKNNIRKKLHSGASSTESTKTCILETNLAPPITSASSKEVKKIMLPDLNLKLPTLPGTSKAHSLAMDEILAHFEQPQPKPILGMDDCPNEDPGNRWIKRLKVSSSSSTRGSKGSSVPKVLPHSKTSNSYSRASSNTCSEVPVVSDIRGDFSKKGNYNNLLPSHAWIQRWLCNRSIPNEKKYETVPVSEPQCSNLPPGNLQKKQFPSIAAMAMTGKAIARFRQPDIHKRGSFSVWETKAF